MNTIEILISDSSVELTTNSDVIEISMDSPSIVATTVNWLTCDDDYGTCDDNSGTCDQTFYFK